MSTNSQLTKRQAEILNYIREYQEEMGAPPTQEEIALQFKLNSTFGVRQHLRLIQKKGYLSLIPGKARGIILTPTVSDERKNIAFEIPLVGRIAAGMPILALENVQEYLTVGYGLFRGKMLFALRVQGDSMVNAGIEEGDIAIINQQPQVENGEIAAVIIDDEATLKRVMLEPDKVRLKAENKHYDDIVVTAESCESLRIAGRFVGLIRQQSPLKSSKRVSRHEQ